MTAQIMDIITIDGHEHRLACEPFDSYIKETSIAGPEFIANCTGCWRGYFAEWAIDNDKLYLTDIEGMLKDKSKATIDTLFPNSKGRVFAGWFTGKLFIPIGKMLEYIHSGYETIYEKELIITIEKGNVVDRTIIENK